MNRGWMLFLTLTIIGAIFLLPIWTMLVTALTPEGAVFVEGARLWPRQISWENFHQLTAAFPFIRWYQNSLTVAGLFTVGQLISCSLTAFALAHFRFRGREALETCTAHYPASSGTRLEFVLLREARAS